MCSSNASPVLWGTPFLINRQRVLRMSSPKAKYVEGGAIAKMDQLKSKRLRITLPRNAAFTVKVRAQPEHLSLQDKMMRVCWIETDLST